VAVHEGTGEGDGVGDGGGDGDVDGPGDGAGDGPVGPAAVSLVWLQPPTASISAIGASREIKNRIIIGECACC
jgi:hypothetical protein